MPAAIKVGCCFLLSDVYSFNSPSSCVVCLHLLHCGCFPVYLVLCLPCVYSNPILSVIPFDCSFVLAQSFLQRSSSFSKCNVHAFAFSTGYLLHISFLPCWLWLLCQYQGFNLLSVPLGFTSPPVCTIDLVHSALFKLHAVYAISHHTASSTSYSTFMY